MSGCIPSSAAYRAPRAFGPRRQRGATAVFAAVALLAMVIAAMLAIEIGRMYSAHRELDKLARTAALDAARIVGGCDREDVASSGDIDDGVASSLTRQGLGSEDLGSLSSAVALGTQTSSDGLRQLDGAVAADEADSVALTLSRPFPQRLLPLLPSNEGRVMRSTAYARQGVVGQIRIGTSLLAIDSERSALLNDLLGALLGAPVRLTVADWQGLLNSDVSLRELIEVGAGVATPDDLLALRMEAGEALQLIADAVAAGDDAGSTTAAAALGQLAALVDPDRRAVTLGEAVVVEEGVEQLAATLPINVLDLVTGLAQLAAQGYALDLPLAGLIDIPGIASVSARLRVGQAPQIALGRPGYRADGTPRTVARSAQIAVTAQIRLLDVAGLLNLPGNPALSVDAIVEAGQGEAVLRQVRCARSGGLAYHEATADVTTAAGRVALGRYSNPSQPGSSIIAPSPLVSLGLLRIGFSRPVIAPVGAETEVIDDPPFLGPFPPKAAFDRGRHSRHVGDPAGAVLGDVASGLLGGAAGALDCQPTPNVPLLNLPGITLCAAIDPLLAASGSLDTLLAPALAVVDVLAGDLLESLGASLGAADVAVERLTVEQPYVFRVD